MLITKMALPRRTFLRGLGATLALPLLDAMVPALTATATAAAPIRRLGFVYIANGAIMDKWTPEAVGSTFDLPPTLRPLAPFRDQMVVVSGLEQAMAYGIGDGSGDHSRAGTAWLSGVHPKHTEGSDIQGGITADQIAAGVIGTDTQLPSLEIGLDLLENVGMCENGYSCVYLNAVAWKTPTTPLFPEPNPRVVFERLFGGGGTADERARRLGEDRSILDSVTESVSRLQKSLGPGDRLRVDEYLDAVRDIERRIQRTEEQNLSAPEAVPDRPVGIPDQWEDHAKLMFDMQVAAYQTDITRVITFMLGRELNGTVYPNSGVPDGHHNLTHHRYDPVKVAKVEKINAYHLKLFSEYYLAKLRATPDGDGSLLDHMLLLYGGGISDGNLHDHSNLPLVLLGGSAGHLKGGRHLKYPDKTPMTNLLVSMLGKLGVPLEKLGDSNGRLGEVEQLIDL
jgi:uncharacterized protein DUF1552